MDPRPAGPADCDLRIGTSGYDYPEWKGVFYPETMARQDFLPAYAQEFATLELNFSYYGMPKAPLLAAMADRLRGSSLDLSVKAFRGLTHEIEPSGLAGTAREFREGIAPLAAAGRLVAILFQFPFRFAYRPEERRYLSRLLDEFADYPRVVEFRNGDWVNARVLEGLRERGVGFCSLDLPRLEGLPPVADIATAELAYIRFHGRNTNSWWRGDARGRYDWLYTEEELRSWLPRIAAMAATAKRLRIYFNNHARGQAVENARDLAALIGARAGASEAGKGAGASLALADAALPGPASRDAPGAPLRADAVPRRPRTP